MKVSQVSIATIFVAMGLAIIALGWLRPLDADQRTMVTIAGAVGIIGAAIFIISRRHTTPPGSK